MLLSLARLFQLALSVHRMLDVFIFDQGIVQFALGDQRFLYYDVALLLQELLGFVPRLDDIAQVFFEFEYKLKMYDFMYAIK